MPLGLFAFVLFRVRCRRHKTILRDLQATARARLSWEEENKRAEHLHMFHSKETDTPQVLRPKKKQTQTPTSNTAIAKSGSSTI